MNLLDDAQSWEASRIESIEKSERRAWIVASVFGSAFVISVAGNYALPPRVETQPYVVRVDNNTGVTDVVSVMQDQVITGNEALDKHHLAKYVIARESYDFYLLQSSYDTVGVMSAADVGKAYAEQYDGDSPLHETYKDRVKIVVSVISVVPGDGIGTVRYSTTTTRSGIDVVNTYVATIGYGYQSTDRMPESVRLVNPLGFRVASYRIDSETVQGASL